MGFSRKWFGNFASPVRKRGCNAAAIMSDIYQREELEIVDLDTCSKKKSILIGVAITAVLGFVPYSYLFLGIHFLLGGVAAAGHFAKRYSVTISAFTGVKLGALASLLGMLTTFVAYPLWALPTITDDEWTMVREQVMKQSYEQGRPEAADFAEKFLVADNVTLFLVVVFVMGFGFSLLLGSLGGLIGSAVFKKGPEAQ